MPPKRMSDILASSHSSTAGTAETGTTTSTSTSTGTSDGPTLPILSAPSAGKKRKRAAHNAQTHNATAERDTEGKQSAAAGGLGRGSSGGGGNIHPALSTPWVLLPSKQRRLVEDQGVEEHGVEEKAGAWQVLVWTRNQNVKSGVRRLLSALRKQPDQGAEEGNEQKRGVVVSAQDAGTVKLVGVFELVRRILDKEGEGGKSADGEGKEGRWYVYTVLSSVMVPHPRKQGDSEVKVEAEVETGADADGESMDIDIDLDQPGDAHAHADKDKIADSPVQQHSTPTPTPTKPAPVLSLWITRTRLPGWKDVFGELEIVVRDRGLS